MVAGSSFIELTGVWLNDAIDISSMNIEKRGDFFLISTIYKIWYIRIRNPRYKMFTV